MKIHILLTLMLGMICTSNAASEPYQGDEGRVRPLSMRTIESEINGADEGFTATDESAFPSSEHRKAKYTDPHHRTADMISPITMSDGSVPSEIVTSNPDTHRSTDQSNSNSMRQFPPVNPGSYFDRDAYLRDQVQELVADEKRFGTTSRICRLCSITWNVAGGASTLAGLAISAAGASEYMAPRLANLLTGVLFLAAGGCIWLGTQAKKAAHQYHEEQNHIQRSLGVPTNWLDREVRIEIDQFNGRGVQPAPTGTR